MNTFNVKATYLYIFIWVLAPNFLIAQDNWEVIEIPMRDGKHLVADLYLPNKMDSFPVVLVQTPYGKFFYRTRGLPLGIGENLESSPYAFVILDWRCRFASLGACSPEATNGEDGYDAVEWIATQSWSNGKIGTLGPSALGNVQYSTAREQPPHLVCAIPEVASPQFNYQQYIPGGVLKAEYLSTLKLLFPGSGFDLVIANPHYNLIWRIAENSTMYPEDIQVPMLLIGGWFDHNTTDNFTMIDTLTKASGPDVSDKHKILIGPWVHGGTGPSIIGSNQQGELSFPEAAGWNNKISLEFFDYYLRDIQNGWNEHKRYIFYQMGDEEWKESNTWPPLQTTFQDYYVASNSIVSNQLPTASSTYSYEYNPQDPSPTIGGKTLSLTLDQGPYDQSEVEARDDNLILSTEPLLNELAVQGRIGVHLYVSSDRPDTDIALRLTDVYPDGRSIQLSGSILRMRFRNGFTVADTAFMKPGVVYPIFLEFDDLAHTFLPGHKMRIIITSSNYPNYNRNMNTGAAMYPDNHPDTLVNPLIANNQIWFGQDNPSRIVVPTSNEVTSSQKVESSELSMRLYPNPASDWIQITGPPTLYEVIIYDLQGRRRKILVINPSRKVLLSGLEPGLYFLTGKDNGGRVFRSKFILSR